MLYRGMLFAIALIFMLSRVACTNHQRQHHHQRRSINYDGRYFGFQFDKEPEGGIFEGRNVHLPCSFHTSRQRAATVEWRKDGSPLGSKDSRIERQENGSLLIREATPSDAGIYECAVHVSDPSDASSWTFLSRKAAVRLPRTPRFLQQPEDISVSPGQHAAFRCLLEEAEGVAVHWLKNGVAILPSGRTRILPMTSSLEILSAGKTDEGVYSCFAESRSGGPRMESMRGRLSLSQGEESELSMVLWPRSQLAKVGEKVLLECLATHGSTGRNGDKTTTEWSKDGKALLINQRIEKVGVSSLMLSQVTAEDAGVYECRVADGTDAVERSAVLEVEAPPLITTSPSDKIAMETSDVELECFASGRPTPTIRWLKNGETLIASEYFAIDTNRLRILGLVKADQGVYQCMAENVAGVAQASVQLLVDSSDSSSVAGSSGEPLLTSSPLGLRVLSVASHEAHVMWDPPLQRHGSLLNYHLYYREEGSQRERVVNSSSPYRWLHDLQAGTAYQLRVAAENEAGIGTLSQPLRIITKKEQAVPGRVQDLHAFAKDSETIEVEWKPPTSSGAPPLRFRLFYVRSDARKTERETQINVPSTAYTMYGMDKYTEYDIRVEAEGENGPGITSETITVRTLADVPSGPPLDISADAQSTTAIRIVWAMPTDALSNGPVTGYRLKYKTKARGSKGNTVLIDAPVTSYSLTGLEPGTAYTLRMAIVNQNGTGAYSDWLSVETPLVEKEESLLGAPRELRPVAGADFIQLFWRPPADDSVLIRGYQIGWGQGVPDVDEARVEASILQHKITGLRPARDYVVSLRAFNRQGLGFPIYETVRTAQKNEAIDGLEGAGAFLAGEDSAASPMGVRAIALSPTAIRVSWADSPTGFNTLYTVKYSSSSDGNALRFINTTEQWVVVENLRPATEYELAVRAFLPPMSLSAWSMAVRNRTLPAAPSSAPRDLTILPAASGDPASVTVNWQPPKYANGEILEYILFYSERPSPREDEWSQLVIPGERLSHSIHSLLPKANYYFRIQAKNVKGFGPLSSVQTYSPGSAGFVHPIQATHPRTSSDSFLSTDWIKVAKANPLHFLVGAALFLLIGLSVLLLSLWVCRRGRQPKPRSTGGSSGRKSSSQQRNDLWIQHGGCGSSALLGGPSGDRAVLGASLADIKHLHGGADLAADSPPPRYQSSLQNRLEAAEPIYGAVLPSGREVSRRTPLRTSMISSTYDEGVSDSSRPLLVVGRAKPMPVGAPPPPPAPQGGYSGSDRDSGGTLSRSYHHSASSLEAARQRTPHVVYSGHPRHQAKVEMGDSPYGSSLGLGSATPPPPSVAPPQPPVVTSDGYRTLKAVPSGSSNLRSFSQLASSSPQPRLASLAGGPPRQVPVGRATAQPRVNVANLCSPYLSNSALSVEEEKQRLREGECFHSDSDSAQPLPPSLSTEALHEQVENIDHMISDLQALQQQFGVKS